MPTFDVPTDGGTYRVETTSSQRCLRVVPEAQGRGGVGPADVPRPGPGENPVIAAAAILLLQTRPCMSHQARPPKTETPLLSPVLDWAVEKVAPAAWDVAKPAILPTTIGAALNYGGAYVPGLNAVPAPARESIGSMIGTGANMALGWEKPSVSGFLMSGVSPGATRKGAQVGTKLLPGAQAARATGLVEEAQALPGILSKGMTQDVAGGLMEQARQLNPDIAMDATNETVKGLFQKEATMPGGLKLPKVQAVAKGLETALAQSDIAGSTPLAVLDAWRQRVGAMIKVAETSEEQGALKQIYASILNDLETAAPQVGGEGAAQLLEGIKESRRVFSAEHLQDMITTATSRPRPVDGLQTLNVGSILKSLESPRGQEQTLLSDFLTKHPEEKAEIVSLLEDMNRRNVKLMPPAGAMAGSAMAVGRAGAGYMVGQGINTLAGSEVVDPKTIGALTAVGSQAISRALLTPMGRTFLKNMLAETGTFNMAQIITQFGGQAARANLGPPAVDIAQRVSTRATGFPGYPAEERR